MIFGNDDLMKRHERSADYASFLQRKMQVGKMSGFDPLWMPDFLKPFQNYLTTWQIQKGRGGTFSDCGTGKAQRIDQRILTESGWMEIGNANIGTRVYGSDGRLHNVVGVYPQGIREMAKVTFSDGSEVICDWDHLWAVKSQVQIYRGLAGRVLKTSDIAANGLEFTGGQKKHFVPLVAPLCFGETILHYIDPYTMGVLLGDGSMTVGTCSVSKPDFSFTQDELPLPDGCHWSNVSLESKCPKFSVVGGEHRNSANPVTRELKRLGIHGKRSEFKFIPQEYLHGSPETRLALIQGLLDTDGSATGPCIEFSSASKKLSDDFIFLVRSLGGTATQSQEPAHYTKDGHRHQCLDKFRSIVKLPHGLAPFRMTRKLAAYNPIQRKNPLKSIVAIESAGLGEAICIRVDAYDSLYVTEGMTLTHNTPMQLVWSQNMAMKTNKPTLLATPIAVGMQTVKEADKFGLKATISRDGKPKGDITITNYQQLHKFDPNEFGAVGFDESSCAKDADSKTKAEMEEFSRTIQYRSLWTATAAPNDYHELGTSSEILGDLGYHDMLTMFFKAEQKGGHHGWIREKYRFRQHAKQAFWKWVCSWSRACRKPSDLGFSDEGFELPPLTVRQEIVVRNSRQPGRLFDVPAVTLEEQREERRATINERCGRVADLISGRDCAVAWCHLNPEGDLLEKMIPRAAQISGRDDEESKERKLLGFSDGSIPYLIIKDSIGAWGMNWQHCNYTTMFPSHSYERTYQAMRRFWRYGQLRPVTCDFVSTEGESNVLENYHRKARQADEMFAAICREMNNALAVKSQELFPVQGTVASWM